MSPIILLIGIKTSHQDRQVFSIKEFTVSHGHQQMVIYPLVKHIWCLLKFLACVVNMDTCLKLVQTLASMQQMQWTCVSFQKKSKIMCRSCQLKLKKKKKNLGIACGTSWSHKKLKQIKLRYPWTAETSITKRTLDVRRIYSGT